jgi:hypothetical protein
VANDVLYAADVAEVTGEVIGVVEVVIGLLVSRWNSSSFGVGVGV